MIHHARHIHHHFVTPHSQSGLMFVGSALRSTGQAMVGVFLFIYCFQLGFSLEILLAYMIWWRLVSILINHFLTSHLVNFLGPQRASAVSNLFLIAFTLGLYALESSLWHLFSLAILQALADHLYYVSQHVFMIQAGQAQTKQHKGAGQLTGKLISAEPLGYGLGPVIGGLLSWLINPQFSIGVGVVILVFGGLLIFKESGWRTKTASHHRIDRTKMWSIYRYFRRSWRLTVVTLANAADQVVFDFWILWLGLVLVGDIYGLIGVTQFAGAMLGFLVARWVGRRIDKGLSPQLLKTSWGLNLSLGLARFWATILVGLGFKLLIAVYALLDWLSFELRSGPIYEQTQQQAKHWQKYQVEYCICFSNLADLARGLMAVLALGLSLLTTSDTKLLATMFVAGTAINLVYWVRFQPKQA